MAPVGLYVTRAATECDAGEHPYCWRNSPLQAFTVQVGVSMKEILYWV